MDISRIHNKLLPVLENAKKIALDKFGKSNKIHIKQDVASQAAIVTEVDKELDSLFRKELAYTFPGTGFITEENSNKEIKEYNWIIDPIDGTTNYSRNFPLFGISVALWRKNESVYGCLVLPSLGKIMYGWKEGGVFVNDKKMERDTSLSPKPFVFLAPVAKPEEHGEVTRIIGDIISAPRDFGCSVYQSFEAIMGNADLAVNYKLSLWDIGASILLAKESGLAISFISPEPNIYSKEDYSHTVVFGRPDLVQKITKELRTCINA